MIDAESPQQSGEYMTAVQVVERLFRLAAADHWDLTLDQAVVQVTMDDEHFYAIKSISVWGDGGLVAEVEPWPPETDTNGGQS